MMIVELPAVVVKETGTEASTVTSGVIILWPPSAITERDWVAPTPSHEVLLMSSHAHRARTVEPIWLGKNFVQPPSFWTRPIPFRSGMNRTRLVLEIAASLSARVLFWSTPGTSFRELWGMI